MHKASLQNHKAKCVLEKFDKAMLIANLKREMLTLDQGKTFVCQLGCEGVYKFFDMVEHLLAHHK